MCIVQYNLNSWKIIRFYFPRAGIEHSATEIDIFWVSVHHPTVISGVGSSNPTASMGLSLSETWLEKSFDFDSFKWVGFKLDCTFSHITQIFHHFPPPTKDYLVTNISPSRPNSDLKWCFISCWWCIQISWAPLWHSEILWLDWGTDNPFQSNFLWIQEVLCSKLAAYQNQWN